jgi:hypothetical protein
MDWLSGLGQGFSNIGPAIQFMMQMQAMKQEAAQRSQFHADDLASALATRQQRAHEFDVTQAGDTRREFLDPLAKQGIVVDPGAYDQAANIPAPELRGTMASPDVGQGVAATGNILAKGLGDQHRRIGDLRTAGATALGEATAAGPGHVTPFEGGIAFGQQPFPNRSESTSFSTSNDSPDKLRLAEMHVYVEGKNDYVSRMVSNYQAVNRYGGNPEDETRVATQASEHFDSVLWPSMQLKMRGTTAPIGPQGPKGRATTHSHSGIDPNSPPLDTAPTDFNEAFDRQLGRRAKGYGTSVRSH